MRARGGHTDGLLVEISAVGRGSYPAPRLGDQRGGLGPRTSVETPSGGCDALATGGVRHGDVADEGQGPVVVDGELVDDARAAGLHVEVVFVAADRRIDSPRVGRGVADEREI